MLSKCFVVVRFVTSFSSATYSSTETPLRDIPQQYAWLLNLLGTDRYDNLFLYKKI